MGCACVSICIYMCMPMCVHMCAELAALTHSPQAPCSSVYRELCVGPWLGLVLRGRQSSWAGGWGHRGGRAGSSMCTFAAESSCSGRWAVLHSAQLSGVSAKI